MRIPLKDITDHQPAMSEKLDERIARVSAELTQLRQQKLEELRRAMRQLESGADTASPARRTYRRLTDDEVRELLEKAVAEAGEGGISAAKAAESASVPYSRVRLLMPKLFKKTGSGGSTLYVLKPRRGKGAPPAADASPGIAESSPSEEPAQ